MTGLGHLWAGWRSPYLSGEETTERPEGVPADPVACVFCWILEEPPPDASRHLLFADELSAVVLNAYPYTSGHVLVLPRRHCGELEELAEEEADALWSTGRRAVLAVRQAYRPDGVNLGANLGKAAGAGIPGHLHLHVLPRWHGDTNFMTTVADARVLPEPLGVSFDKLLAAWPV